MDYYWVHVLLFVHVWLRGTHGTESWEFLPQYDFGVALPPTISNWATNAFKVLHIYTPTMSIYMNGVAAQMHASIVTCISIYSSQVPYCTHKIRPHSLSIRSFSPSLMIHSHIMYCHMSCADKRNETRTMSFVLFIWQQLSVHSSSSSNFPLNSINSHLRHGIDPYLNVPTNCSILFFPSSFAFHFLSLSFCSLQWLIICIDTFCVFVIRNRHHRNRPVQGMHTFGWVRVVWISTF